MKKDELLAHLAAKDIVMVDYTKKDGSSRIVVCTTKFGMIPEEHHPKTWAKPKEDSVHVFDIDKQGWRTLIFDQATDVVN